MLLFASEGDAWLLEPTEKLVMRLTWHGENQAYTVEYREQEILVGWDGIFRLNGMALILETEHPAVGSRRVLGYTFEAALTSTERVTVETCMDAGSTGAR